MLQPSQTQITIAKQIGAKELHFAKFILVLDGSNKVIVSKGQKAVSIEYSEGSDTYNIVRYTRDRNFNTKSEEKLTNIYCDQLQDLIAEHFKFEYVFPILFRSN